MKINCYINFNGNCKEALEFYGKAFGVEPKIMTFGELPPNSEFPLNEEAKRRVIHGMLEVEGHQILCSDVLEGHPFAQGNHMSISLSSPKKEELTHWFYALSEGGQVEMPLGQTFWSEMYGCFTDRFGIGWQVNYQE